jgi:hypothetical protein
MDTMTFQGITFDDYVDEENGAYWSQVCPTHAEETLGRLTITACDGLTCGVKGCEGEASDYVDFDQDDITE